MKNVDLIIIGGGPAGYETALLAAKNGLQTVLIESKKLGGTCLNEGCIPTKCLCRSAEIKRLLGSHNTLNTFGVEDISYSFNINNAIQRKNQVVDTLNGGIKAMLKAVGVEVIYGNASFKSGHVIAIDFADNETNDLAETEYTAPYIMIATGAVTKVLPIEGANLPGVLTSREILDIKTTPKDLCIIGGGVIGMELASIFSAFGSNVTVIEYFPEILSNLDRDMSKRLRVGMGKKGVKFHLKSSVTGIVKTGNGQLTVKYVNGDEEKEVNAEVVLMATGRVANIDNLNLACTGISLNKRAIEVDENYETSEKDVYAIGDVNGICQLAHAAKFQGMHALTHILGKSDDVDFNMIPAVVFTSPEFASVGLSEEDCKNRSLSYRAHKSQFGANGKAAALGETEGLVKILATPEGTILGAHILGAHASDLIHEIAMAMRFKGNLSDICSTIHAHPTLSEIVLDAAGK